MRWWSIGVVVLWACGPRVEVPGGEEGGGMGDSSDDDPTTGPRGTGTSTTTSAPPPTATDPTLTTAPPPTLDVPSPTDGPVEPPLEGVWLCERPPLPYKLEIYGVEADFPIGQVCVPGLEPVEPEGWDNCGATLPHVSVGFSYYFTTSIYSKALMDDVSFDFGFEYDYELDQLVGLTIDNLMPGTVETSCSRYP